ncbi:MutS-related protein [Butyrivibrio sp. X503]|uniref:MutS-related protein n=1 Tax=Butyrivibrio sp. X503 TaxID=2364878 RepID=UPI001314E934|nr:hypothetical protein [Butyrivibrio sp. X503]
MDGIVIFAVVACGILLIYLFGIRDRIVFEKRLTKYLKDNYGNAPKREYKSDELDHLRGYYDNHKEDFQIDDITWNDLNMDGVFARMNYCLSASGEEYLYYMLRTPKTEDDFDDIEKKVSFFSENEEARIKYQLIFSRIGRGTRFSIYDYLNLLGDALDSSNAKHYLMIALIVLAVIVCFFNFAIGFLAVVALCIINIVLYFKDKNKIEPYLATYRYVLKAINSVNYFSKAEYPEVSDDIYALRIAASNLKGFSKGSYILMSPSRMNSGSDPFNMLLDYLRILLHLDIIKFNKMYKFIMEKKDDLEKIITTLGRLEAFISVACFRESVKENYSIPDFSAASYSAKDLIHPLIEEPVPNTVTTDKGILITGSNASGKSTFLKTAAINAVLSQSIHTSLASEYKAPLYRIYSSMALNDNIFEGDSYYIVEIKSMKRIIDASKETTKAPVLCFVDEVLRGTNTVERIAASTEILKSFANSGVLCFAATHDIELTTLLDEYYNLYHFEGNVTDNDVHFDYMIKDGAAINRNAIKLLNVLGYDEGIVERAQELADKFTKTGVWA